MGGKTAICYSFKYPERLNGLIWIDSPPKNNAHDPQYISKTYGLVI